MNITEAVKKMKEGYYCLMQNRVIKIENGKFFSITHFEYLYDLEHKNWVMTKIDVSSCESEDWELVDAEPIKCGKCKKIAFIREESRIAPESFPAGKCFFYIFGNCELCKQYIQSSISIPKIIREYNFRQKRANKRYLLEEVQKKIQQEFKPIRSYKDTISSYSFDFNNKLYNRITLEEKLIEITYEIATAYFPSLDLRLLEFELREVFHPGGSYYDFIIYCRGSNSEIHAVDYISPGAEIMKIVIKGALLNLTRLIANDIPIESQRLIIYS